MIEFSTVSPDWTSYSQLVQQLIAGQVRKHVFTRWELDLLLEVQMTRMRKSSRPEIFRRYLRNVDQARLIGAARPPQFTRFYESEIQGRRTVAAPPEIELLQAS